MQRFGSWIRERREDVGLSMGELARLLGKTGPHARGYIANIEKERPGRNDTLPGKEVLPALADHLKVPREEMLRRYKEAKAGIPDSSVTGGGNAEQTSGSRLFQKGDPWDIPGEPPTKPLADEFIDEIPPGLAIHVLRLPVYGDVSCGWGSDVDERPIEYQQWPDFVANGADHIVQVRGDSMQDVGITGGSVVFVKKAPKNWRKVIPDGKTVIARYTEDGSYTCKIIGRIATGRDKVVTLQGAGPGFDRPTSEFERPFEVVGVVTFVGQAR